ncbi:MAG: hemolysin family protein [Coriobacteriia bacterium]|nr:hemolysin family protein [Coriobacteriia bacterium]
MIPVVVGMWVVLMVLSTVLSASETSVLLLSVGRVHRLVEAERKGALSLYKLADGRHRLRAASELLAGLAYGAGWFAGWVVGTSYEGALSGGVLGLLAVVVTYSVAQALPRTLAVTNPEPIALDSAPIAWSLTRAIYPVAALLGAPWKWGIALTGAERPFSPWAVTPEWRGSVESEEHAEREEAEEALLEAVSDFAEKVVREVMVPRTDMHALEDTATVAEAVALISHTGVSRVPVYHETIDDVRGMLYAKDLLTALQEGSDATLASLARKPHFVPETKPVQELLVEMRATTHIAIVADEYGGTSGLVTLEDLLEEIVGEISDEYDREELLIEELGEGRFRVDARLPVDDLNELFGTDLEIDADSVGGLFTEVAGHIPEVGESVQLEGLRLTVTVLEGTRIRQLCVEPAGTGGNGDDDA